MSTYVFERFKGHSAKLDGKGFRALGKGVYIASARLATAVNAALAAEQPLLVTGAPGTGKTALAYAIASELGAKPVLAFHTRSDHRARDALYRFDAMRRFYDAQTSDPRAKHPAIYRTFAALGEAIASEEQRVVLIDEIDKAPRDFPNDLLNEIDQMQFRVEETGETIGGTQRPIVVITSNDERPLPDAFLRRCVFHRIDFPTPAELRLIVGAQFEEDEPMKRLIDVAVERFVSLRGEHELVKPPSTGELLVWIRVLQRAGKTGDDLLREKVRSAELPCLEVLLKVDEDRAVVASA